MIVQQGRRYIVQAESGRSLGSYATRREAEKRLAEVEMFKAMRERTADPKQRKRRST